MSSYEEKLTKEVNNALEVANEVRGKRGDPKESVEIELADDIAGRCEKLLGIDGLAERIRDLEDKGYDREEIAFELTDDFANKNIGSLESDEEIIDSAIRTAVALLTEGVVAAPIEGIGDIKIEKNDDGTSFVRVPYFGPIRSAGGTGQALSVLVADYIRQKLDIDEFKPRDNEIERYVEELRLYDEEVSLQYMPKEKEIKHIVKNVPIMVDGTPTTDREVEGYRDLERIDGNKGRGGMCLVMGEGIAQKAPKIKRYTDDLDDIEGWDWLNELELVSTGNDSSDDDSDEELSSKEKNKDALKPKDKFMQDILAARPVFSGPSEEGGFRIRYGRARNTGLAATGFHPATMVIVDDFIATGTQLKTEKPGKAAGVAPVDGIEGPAVRLADGSVKRIDSVEEAQRVSNGIEKIIDLGETAIPYGEFVENNHPLLPSPYVTEWWVQELEKSNGSVEDYDGSAKSAFEIADEYDIPLHPDHTYLWHDISTTEYEKLSESIEKTPDKNLLPNDVKEILEKLLVEHSVDEDGRVVIDDDVSYTLSKCCSSSCSGESTMERVNNATEAKVKKRSPIRIGARMGRPEKASRREMRPSVHGLFPVGHEGGDERLISEAAEHQVDTTGFDNDESMPEKGVIQAEIANRYCDNCEEETYSARCPDCEKRTTKIIKCSECERIDNSKEQGQSCDKCGSDMSYYSERPFNVKKILDSALDDLGERMNIIGKVKGVKGLTSETKLPEPVHKSILRKKHDVETFRDGTARFDMTDLPLTSFKPEEIGLSVEQAKELGYETDIDGNELENPSQLVELKLQDLIISKDGAEYMLSVANFVDELLVKYYDSEPYYEADEIEDLIGELLVGMAPHTSAGVVGRLIGFTDASVGYAHPFYHAAKRRNADGDEDCVMLLMDGLVNFSREFLPDIRGKRTMDAPLVLSSTLDPYEIDDEAHNVDIEGQYPISFYEATQKLVDPDEVDVTIAEDVLESPKGFESTIETSGLSLGPTNSAYKKLGSMTEKTMNQIELAKRIRAIDEDIVAEEVIEQHFFPDIIGNLTAFGRQDVRCPKCNSKYRRPPLSGNCERCGGGLILTVHEGSVNKYIEICQDISEQYELRDYTVQRLEQLSDRIDSLFEDDQEKQSNLGDFV